jgi:thiol-disulfide isomerase/thioredoxin
VDSIQLYYQERKGMTTYRYLQQLKMVGIFACFFILYIPQISAGNAFSGSSMNLSKKDSLKLNDEAPPFVMRDLLTDNAIFLRDFTGKTLREPWKKKNRYVVVLSFWATWCQPCKIEIPALEKLAENMKNQPIKFFLINTMEKSESNEDSIKQIYISRGYKIPCLLDPAMRFAGIYTVHGLPMLVVIDKFGIVRKINRGYDENFNIELEKLLKELVSEDGTSKK